MSSVIETKSVDEVYRLNIIRAAESSATSQPKVAVLLFNLFLFCKPLFLQPSVCRFCYYESHDSLLVHHAIFAVYERHDSLGLWQHMICLAVDSTLFSENRPDFPVTMLAQCQVIIGVIACLFQQPCSPRPKDRSIKSVVYSVVVEPNTTFQVHRSHGSQLPPR